MIKRHANAETTNREYVDGQFVEVSTERTYKLGIWEIMQVQAGLELLPEEARKQMAHLAHILGSSENTSITITVTEQR